MIEEKKYWIWFSLIKGLGIKKKQILLKIYKNPKKIYYQSRNELLKINGIGIETANNVLDKTIKEAVNKHISYMIKNNIDIIPIVDKNYPQSLKQIYDPPVSLYIKGNKEILNKKGISIIGCREASEYGKKAAKYFGYNLSKNGVNIISGLAKGVDSYSHMGNCCALIERNYSQSKNYKHVDKIMYCGKPIAVVGNGLDMVYPLENKKLQQKIIELGGCIISEYPIGTKPRRIHFPARNRIISGMSGGVIVIEAKEKSGTLITVDFALEQGKDIYVVPGNINSINSVGTNELIKQGGKLITTYRDVEI